MTLSGIVSMLFKVRSKQNYTYQRLCILNRNEGKIKSYGSCSDVRAWCHDAGARNSYLREWMKSNMPISVIPITTWASLLRIMSCRRREKATPRCHPDCKSKIVLDHICETCEEVRKILKHDGNFEKYFNEEELDTSHWPAEKCLDALRSIKMFWKIIYEKVFNVNLSKTNEIEKMNCAKCDNINDIANMWTQEIIQQTLLVKESVNRKDKKRKQNGDILKDPYTLPDIEGMKYLTSLRSSYTKIPGKKISRYTSVKKKTINVASEANDTEQVEELKMYKSNLYRLQEQLNSQFTENDKLKTENASLKLELQNIYKSFPWKSPFHSPTNLGLGMNNVPKPFEISDDESVHLKKTDNVDSEMFITLKNGQNDSLKHIEILQVLHKTNVETFQPKTESKISFKKEDPVVLLKRVQNTFGAIFKREISIASDRRRNDRALDINATFQRVHPCPSAPSCSTLSAYSSCST